MALLISADVPDGQEAGVAARTAEAARAGEGPGSSARRLTTLAGALHAELRQSLQSAPVHQQQQPEQLRAAATLVDVDADRALLFFAYLRGELVVKLWRLVAHLVQ